MYSEIQQAITSLLSVCDGAYTHDGQGFNKVDAGFCRWLASRYPDWSGASAYRAWEVLRKYKGQLAGFGIMYDTIPIPQKDAPRPQRKEPERKPLKIIWLTNGVFTISFPYDPLIVAQARAIPGAKFDKQGKLWRAPLSIDSAEPILRLAHEHGFELADGTGEDIVAYIDGLEKAKEASKAVDAEIEIPGLHGTLMPFQKAGVLYCLHKFGVDVSFFQNPLDNGDGEEENAEWGLSENKESTQGGSCESCEGKGTGGPRKVGSNDVDNCIRREVEREGIGGNEESTTQAGDPEAALGRAKEILGLGEVQLERRKRAETNGGNTASSKNIDPDGFRSGICDTDKRTWYGGKATGQLQGGLCSSQMEKGNRNGWAITSKESAERKGQKENKSPSRLGVGGNKNTSSPGGVLIGDVPGLGKTIQSLAVVQAMGAYPAVFVVPSIVKWNWKREAEKWVPHKKTVVLEGTKANGDLRGIDIIILNYDILHAWIDKLREIKPITIIYDEVHMAKEKRSRRSKAAKSLAEGVPYLLALSGSPLLNRPIELAHPLNILRRLEEFGGWWRFATRYANAHRNRFGLDVSGASNLGELSIKLRQVCMVRRQKSEVLQELPPKTISVIEVDLENQKEYEAAEQNVILFLGQRAAKDAAFLASIAGHDAETQAILTRQHRASAEEKAARAEALVRIGTLKQIAAQGKLSAVNEWISNFLDSGEKLVLFAWHKKIQDAIFEAHPGAARIVGEDDSEDRQANVDRFQNDPSCRLIVCSIMAGGIGITLTAASDVLMVELPWNPSLFDQAVDRLHRIGQSGSVTCWTMLGKNSIDMDIWDLISRKRNDIDVAIDGSGAVAQESMLKELVDKLMRKEIAK